MCGTTFDNFFDGRVTVFVLKSGSNTLKFETHVDFKISQRLRRHVAGVRIETVSH